MQPLWNEPALSFQGQGARWLAVSELHIGFESEIATKGAFIKSQTPRLIKHLLMLAKRVQASRLLILGDVKQRVQHISPQERRDVPAFFDALAGFHQVIITRGNHDAGLQNLVTNHRHPNVTIAPATGIVLGKGDSSIGACHGHAWPKPSVVAASTLLIGHTHAAARVVDQHGVADSHWAWARGRLDPDRVQAKYGAPSDAPVIVFPPFNPLLGGSPVNLRGLLGPMRHLVEPSSLQITLLDGRQLASD